MRKNIIDRCIKAINFRLQFYLKNTKRIDFLQVLESKGKWFLFRFFIYALVRETHVYLSYFLRKSNNPIIKIVFFAQGSSGCSLLAELLRSHPQFQYDDEILFFNVFFPLTIIKAMCALSKKDIYGIKIKINQLTYNQNIQDPKQFIHELYREGWKIIYLKRRNMFHQQVYRLLFLQKYKNKQKYKSKDTLSRGDKTYIDCNNLIEGMKRREMFLAQEKKVLENLPHLEIVFEDDVLRAKNHQRTLDKILDFLNIPSVPVKTVMIMSSTGRLSDVIQNYDEIVQAVSKTKYAGFLEAEGRNGIE